MNDREKKLWKKVFRYLKFLRMIPFLRMVAVCNNLAFGKTDENSDIDLFVIAEKERLFTARILLTGLLHILGVRRHGNKIAERFCLSFFVDDNNLDLSKIALENDIYLAFWIKSMLPVIDDGVSEDFLKTNDWAKRFFEKEDDFAIDGQMLMSSRKSWLQNFFSWILNGMFGCWFEKRMQNWQIKRAKFKARLAGNDASLIVDEHMLKFHNIDRRREYRSAWIKEYGEESKLNREKFLAMKIF